MQCILGREKSRNAAHNAFLNTLTMGTAFPSKCSDWYASRNYLGPTPPTRGVFTSDEKYLSTKVLKYVLKYFFGTYLLVLGDGLM